jgi:hypothetical protein
MTDDPDEIHKEHRRQLVDAETAAVAAYEAALAGADKRSPDADRLESLREEWRKATDALRRFDRAHLPARGIPWWDARRN